MLLLSGVHGGLEWPRRCRSYIGEQTKMAQIPGLQQRGASEPAEMSQSRYSLFERGEAIPTAKQSEAIDRVLELPDELRKELRRVTTQLDA